MLLFFFVILFSIRAHDDDARSSAPHVHSRAHVYSGLKKWFLVFASVVFFFSIRIELLYSASCRYIF